MISILLSFWHLFYGPWCGLSCWPFHLLLKRMYNLLLLGGVFIYVSYILMADYLFNSSMPFLIFCSIVLSIADSEILKFPTIIVGLSVSALSSVSFCLVYSKILFLVCTHLGLYLLDGVILLSLCSVPICL